MSKRDPLVLLEDIMLAIQKIVRYTSQMDHDAFLKCAPSRVEHYCHVRTRQAL
jgi:uncharacterized protein with HEPN domain